MVMAFHILLVQIGINVFNFSCYCMLIVETSLIPHTQVCGESKILTNQCCSSNVQCTIPEHKEENNSCGKNKTEYKKASLIAQIVEYEFHFSPSLPAVSEPLNLFREGRVSSYTAIPFNFCTNNLPSGRLKRIWHCSLTC